MIIRIIKVIKSRTGIYLDLFLVRKDTAQMSLFSGLGNILSRGYS
jgi:hypothetical protein